MSEQKPEDAIEIPSGVVVECPLAGGALREVLVCAACQHHRGLTPARFPGRPSVNVGADFALQHQVACGYPIARRVLRLESVDEEVSHAGTD